MRRDAGGAGRVEVMAKRSNNVVLHRAAIVVLPHPNNAPASHALPPINCHSRLPRPALPCLLPQAEQDIEDRKRELVEARQELGHKQEYEALRKQIMQVGWGRGAAGEGLS